MTLESCIVLLVCAHSTGNARMTPVTMQATPKVAMNQNQSFSPELSRPLLGWPLPTIPPPSSHHFRSPFSGRLLTSHMEIISRHARREDPGPDELVQATSPPPPTPRNPSRSP